MHHQPKDFRCFRPAINKVTQENSLSPFGRCDAIAVDAIAEFLKQLDELVVAPMNIANDIEGPAILFSIVPKLLTLNDHLINSFRRLQDVHVAKPLSLQSP